MRTNAYVCLLLALVSTPLYDQWQMNPTADRKSDNPDAVTNLGYSGWCVYENFNINTFNRDFSEDCIDMSK